LYPFDQYFADVHIRSTDIRKPVTAKKTALIERPAQTASHTPTTTSDSLPEPPTYTEPLSEDEEEVDDHVSDDEEEHAGKGDPMRRAANDELGVAGLPADARARAEDAKAYREKNQSASSYLQASDATVNPPSSSKNAENELNKLTPKNLKKLLAQKYEQEEIQRQEEQGQNGKTPGAVPNEGPGAVLDENQTEYVQNFTYSGKRISVPVRVEPKVNFALERTLLVSVFE